MKKSFLCVVVVSISFIQHAFSQNGVAISATPAIPHPSAMLDISSSNKGFLLPRLSTTQRTGIATPTDGLMVYDSTIKKLMYYNQKVADWKLVGDSLQIPFNKSVSFSLAGGSGYEPGSALFSLTNTGSNAAGLFKQKQSTSSARGNAFYTEYDANHFSNGYNSAMSAYGMNGRYTVGVSCYSDSTAALAAYNLYRGTAIMAQNYVGGGGGPYAGIASGIFNTNKTLEGYACGIYQSGIASSPIVFDFSNAAIAGYSETGAGGKFFGTDTALHALGNTYLMGNLRIANGSQGNGKVLRSDAGGNASWSNATRSDVFTISAASLQPLAGNGNSADYSIDAGATSPYNDITITNTSVSSPLVAPVNLPNGATITGFNFYAYDNNNVVGLRAELVATPNNGTGNTVYLSANSGAAYASGSFYSGFAAAGIPVPVNNATNSYMIKIYPVDAGGLNVNWASLLYIKSVVISYTYSPL